MSVGLDLSISSARSGKAFLFIVAADASDNTKKALFAENVDDKIPVITKYEKAQLGKIVGGREVAVVAVLDEGMANKLLSL